jgi:hypothetical protein
MVGLRFSVLPDLGADSHLRRRNRLGLAITLELTIHRGLVIHFNSRTPAIGGGGYGNEIRPNWEERSPA